ncbi:hypothetical protein Tco_1337853 [Tanacetum coccineum]
MANIRTCNKHNMIACVEKTAHNADFYQIIDYLTRCSINYSLLVDPDLIGPWLQQFWATASLRVINEVPHIRAMVAGTKGFDFEKPSWADVLFRTDADGVDCFPKQVIWDSLRDIGYEGNLAQLTFSKPLFSPQWKVQVLKGCSRPLNQSAAQASLSQVSDEVKVMPEVQDASQTSGGDEDFGSLCVNCEVGAQEANYSQATTHKRRSKDARERSLQSIWGGIIDGGNLSEWHSDQDDEEQVNIEEEKDASDVKSGLDVAGYNICELTLSSLDVLQGFSLFLQMGFTLILATLDGLDAQLSLKEAEATEAIRLRSQVVSIGGTKAAWVNELNSLKGRNATLEGQVTALEFAAAIKDTELASHRLSLSKAMIPLIEPLSAESLVGEASTFGVPTTAITTALSTTFTQTSSVPSTPCHSRCGRNRTLKFLLPPPLYLKRKSWRPRRSALRLVEPTIIVVLPSCEIGLYFVCRGRV